MDVKIRLLSNLKRFAPGQSDVFTLQIQRGASVQELLEKLNIPSSIKRVILVNERHESAETTLTENDTITIFPPMGGG